MMKSVVFSSVCVSRIKLFENQQNEGWFNDKVGCTVWHSQTMSTFNSARFLSICYSVCFKKLYRAGDRRIPHNSKTNDEQILTALNSCRMAQSEKGLGLASIHKKWCQKKLQQQRRGSNPFIQLSTLFEIIGFHKALYPLRDCYPRKVC